MLSQQERLKMKQVEALLRKKQIENKRRKLQESGNNVETSLIKYTDEKYLIDHGHWNTERPTQNIKFSDKDKSSENYKAYHGKVLNVKK